MMKNRTIKLWILLIPIITFAGVGVFAQRDRIGTSQWKLVEANGRAVMNSNAYFEIDNDGTRFTAIPDATGCSAGCRLPETA